MAYRIGCIFVAAALAVAVLSGGGRAVAANPVVTATLRANGHTVTTTTIDLTVGGVVQGSIAGVSNASPQNSGTMLVASLPDDASFTYTCDAGPSTTYTIPTPTLVLGAKYKLTCPSPGGTITASAPIAPVPTDAFIVFSPASVGGVAEVPSGGAPSLSATAPAGDSGLPMVAWAGILGAMILGVAVLGGGALYIRKRG